MNDSTISQRNQKTKTFKTQKGTELPLLDLRGKDYLTVPFRVVWFREEHPGWSIQTEFRELGATHAVAKATISDENGKIIATAHKREDKQGFTDFMEKAETGATGRALALCGYGTQFAQELEENSRIVDSPQPLRSVPHEFDDLRPHKQAASAPNWIQAEEQESRDTFPGFPMPEEDTYVIPFGKFQGKSLRDVAPSDLISYCDFLMKKASTDSKPLSPAAKTLLEKVNEFIKGVRNDI